MGSTPRCLLAAACLLASLLAACSPPVDPEYEALMRDLTAPDIPSAAGSPAGFYPGRQGKVWHMEEADYQQYLQQRKVQIDRIAARAEMIRTMPGSGGCIGRDVVTCVATLAQTLAVATPFRIFGSSEDTLFAAEKTDVNGNPIFPRNVFIAAYVPPQPNRASAEAVVWIDLGIGDDRLVRGVDLQLPADPLRAKTIDDYDRTAAYDAALPYLDGNCREKMDRQAFYRFIENELKNGMKGNHDTSWSGTDVTVSDGVSSSAGLCGRKIYFFSSHGNATQLISRDNQSGSFGGGSLRIE